MRSQQIQTNFTAGEISPRLLGRVDLPQYANALEICENANPLVQGGAMRSPGSRWVAESKTSAERSWLIPFTFSTSQAYVLEFGKQYIRFYKDGARIENPPGTPVEVATPYLEADLPIIEFTQQADTLILFHPGYFPRRLTRLSDTSWKLSQLALLVEPAEELGDAPTTTISLSATTGAITVTAGAACFQNGDVGRQITSGLGLATITGFTSTTQVSATVLDAFASVGPIASGSWTLTGSPQSTCTPSVSGPEGASVNLTTGGNAWHALAALVDTNKYVEINGGLVEITSIGGATVAAGIVREVLQSTAAAAAGGWRLLQKAWSARFGYPSAGVFHDQRLVAGGVPALPSYVWGSRIGEYLNFARSTNDDAGFSFEMVSAEYNRVLHLVGSRALIPLTSGGEFSVSGGDQPLTPTSARRLNLSDYGSSTVRPVRFGNDVIFVQSSGRKVRALAYTSEREGYTAPDLTRFSDHITLSGILQMAMQREPESILWAVRADGVLAALTLYREAQEIDQGLSGWARRTTDGVFESVARINVAGVDQIWVIVRRTVNGVTKRYVEYFDADRNTDACIVGTTFSAVSGATWSAGTVTITKNAHGYATGDKVRHRNFVPAGYSGDYTITVTGPNAYTYALAVDPGTVTTLGQSGKATAAWSGLGHLEAKTVDILADSIVMPTQVVTAGAVTLPRAAYEVEIGLHYRSVLRLLPIEVSPGTGTAQAGEVSVHEATVRLKDSLGVSIQGDPIPFRRFGPDILDQAVQPFTGDKEIGLLADSTRGVIEITQEQPLPFHVLSVVRRFTFNDG